MLLKPEVQEPVKDVWVRIINVTEGQRAEGMCPKVLNDLVCVTLDIFSHCLIGV